MQVCSEKRACERRTCVLIPPVCGVLQKDMAGPGISGLATKHNAVYFAKSLYAAAHEAFHRRAWRHKGEMSTRSAAIRQRPKISTVASFAAVRDNECQQASRSRYAHGRRVQEENV